jgi:hypothetical protein
MSAPGERPSKHVEFQVPYDHYGKGGDDEDVEDSIGPYIQISNPVDDISKMFDPDDIVFDFTKATLIIDYPLHTPAKFIIQSSSDDGFTRKEIAEIVCEKYQIVYTEEDQEVGFGDAGAPSHADLGGFLLNRIATHGKYGIWGHSIGDLVLHTITANFPDDDIPVLTLSVDS